MPYQIQGLANSSRPLQILFNHSTSIIKLSKNLWAPVQKYVGQASIYSFPGFVSLKWLRNINKAWVFLLVKGYSSWNCMLTTLVKSISALSSRCMLSPYCLPNLQLLHVARGQAVPQKPQGQMIGEGVVF